MSQWRPAARRRGPRLGRTATRVGSGILLVAVPLAVGALLGLVAQSATVSAALATAAAAVTDPPATSRLPWLFRVGALGVLAGSWILGFGLVVGELWDNSNN